MSSNGKESPKMLPAREPSSKSNSRSRSPRPIVFHLSKANPPGTADDVPPLEEEKPTSARRVLNLPVLNEALLAPLSSSSSASSKELSTPPSDRSNMSSDPSKLRHLDLESPLTPSANIVTFEQKKISSDGVQKEEQREKGIEMFMSPVRAAKGRTEADENPSPLPSNFAHRRRKSSLKINPINYSMPPMYHSSSSAPNSPNPYASPPSGSSSNAAANNPNHLFNDIREETKENPLKDEHESAIDEPRRDSMRGSVVRTVTALDTIEDQKVPEWTRNNSSIVIRDTQDEYEYEEGFINLSMPFGNFKRIQIRHDIPADRRSSYAPRMNDTAALAPALSPQGQRHSASTNRRGSIYYPYIDRNLHSMLFAPRGVHLLCNLNHKFFHQKWILNSMRFMMGILVPLLIVSHILFSDSNPWSCYFYILVYLPFALLEIILYIFCYDYIFCKEIIKRWETVYMILLMFPYMVFGIWKDFSTGGLDSLSSMTYSAFVAGSVIGHFTAVITFLLVIFSDAASPVLISRRMKLLWLLLCSLVIIDSVVRYGVLENENSFPSFCFLECLSVLRMYASMSLNLGLFVLKMAIALIVWPNDAVILKSRVDIEYHDITPMRAIGAPIVKRTKKEKLEEEEKKKKEEEEKKKKELLEKGKNTENNENAKEEKPEKEKEFDALEGDKVEKEPTVDDGDEAVMGHVQSGTHELLTDLIHVSIPFSKLKQLTDRPVSEPDDPRRPSTLSRVTSRLKRRLSGVNASQLIHVRQASTAWNPNDVKSLVNTSEIKEKESSTLKNPRGSLPQSPSLFVPSQRRRSSTKMTEISTTTGPHHHQRGSHGRISLVHVQTHFRGDSIFQNANPNNSSPNVANQSLGDRRASGMLEAAISPLSPISPMRRSSMGSRKVSDSEILLNPSEHIPSSPQVNPVTPMRHPERGSLGNLNLNLKELEAPENSENPPISTVSDATSASTGENDKIMTNKKESTTNGSEMETKVSSGISEGHQRKGSLIPEEDEENKKTLVPVNVPPPLIVPDSDSHPPSQRTLAMIEPDIYMYLPSTILVFPSRPFRPFIGVHNWNRFMFDRKKRNYFLVPLWLSIVWVLINIINYDSESETFMEYNIVACVLCFTLLSSIIAEFAEKNECSLCVRTIDAFVSLYGAEAGNLALKLLPRGGLFIAGGIAPKLKWALFKENQFLKAFQSKGRMQSVLEKIPVFLVVHPEVGLLGAKVMCRRLLKKQRICKLKLKENQPINEYTKFIQETMNQQNLTAEERQKLLLQQNAALASALTSHPHTSHHIHVPSSSSATYPISHSPAAPLHHQSLPPPPHPSSEQLPSLFRQESFHLDYEAWREEEKKRIALMVKHQKLQTWAEIGIISVLTGVVASLVTLGTMKLFNPRNRR